jgi:TPR repeat protein
MLGLCYLDGDGCALNPRLAVRWLLAAADQEDTDAWFHLGRCYQLGKGVDQSADNARRWLTRAAAREHPAAREALRAQGIAMVH